MNIEKIANIIKIGHLALELHKAEHCISNAKYRYHNKLRIEGETRPDPRAAEGTEQHDAILATKDEYAAFQAAKRNAYNIKRRLQTACRNF